MWQLDEEVGCAHNYGGVPQPKVIEAVLRQLIAATERTPWRVPLEEISA